MEDPLSRGETPKNKKKRNPSFRRYLRDHGIDVPSLVQGVRDPALPLKRKRNHRRYRQKKAKKIETEAAAATQKNEVAESADSSAIAKRSFCLISPVTASSPAAPSHATPSPSKPSPSPAVTSPENVTLPIRGLRNPYN
ncbi:hypothetical protein DTO006G1_6933 [Penicillium roqueforti]|nr:hypothetical protein CBS147337_6920 [Penicillium roqueforti]KAI2724969.1 hypothetical protein CBS147354_5286 [Penicillium roqueforti]KAI2758113.1 hypothetical protein DTO006G1_6933 [Penicillium roqueforti]KAI3257105.1 hypothetical protein DTO006G7_2672 [Penicillium roqueforti]